jgi:hypothetical protein
LKVGAEEIWVHPNGTKHIVERLTSTGPLARPLSAQVQLSSLQSAVAAADRTPTRELQIIGGWELKFSKRLNDKLTVLKHARYLG